MEFDGGSDDPNTYWKLRVLPNYLSSDIWENWSQPVRGYPTVDLGAVNTLLMVGNERTLVAQERAPYRAWALLQWAEPGQRLASSGLVVNHWYSPAVYGRTDLRFYYVNELAAQEQGHIFLRFKKYRYPSSMEWSSEPGVMEPYLVGSGITRLAVGADEDHAAHWRLVMQPIANDEKYQAGYLNQSVDTHVAPLMMDLDVLMPGGAEYDERLEDAPGYVISPSENPLPSYSLRLHRTGTNGHYRLESSSPAVVFSPPANDLDASVDHDLAISVNIAALTGPVVLKAMFSEDGQHYDEGDRVTLLPVEIVVRKTEATAPETGLLVKKGDVVTFDINGSAPASAFPLPPESVKWKTRQLKRDGATTAWADVAGQGAELDFTTNESGVFEAKAIVTPQGGQASEFPLTRKKDAPHADSSQGQVQDFHKAGAVDYFGVADQQWQIDVRNKALENLGSEYYKNQGECVVQGSTVAPIQATSAISSSITNAETLALQFRSQEVDCLASAPAHH